MTDQEHYRQRVIETFDNFLVSPFIEYKPYSKTDEEIIQDAKHRSSINYDGGRLCWAQSFASIVTIEGIRDMEYNGKDFKQLLLKSENGNIRSINFSDFHYYNSLYKGKDDLSRFGFEYDASNAKYVNLIDTQTVNPEILANKVGCKILIGYSFNTVNSFEKMRTCFRFYSLKADEASDAKIIREQILRAQAFILLLAIKYPALCLPSYNRENIYPYMYEITQEIGIQYASQLKDKLHEVEKSLHEHGLNYENSI